MAVLSKADDLSVVLRNSTCKDLIHPWTNSCTLSALDMAVACHIGGLRFFFVWNLVSLLMKYPEIDQGKVLSALKSTLRSACFTTVFGTCIYYFHCFFRWVLGRYLNATVILIPSFIAGFSLALEHPSKWPGVLFGIGNEFLCWLLFLAQRATGFKLNLTQLTAGFMFFNGLMLYMVRIPKLRKHISKPGFWFYFPPRIREVADQTPACSHDGSCISSLLKETGKVIALGTTVQILRVVISRITSAPMVLLRSIFQRRNFTLGAFFGAYVAIYKVVSCFLCRVRGRDSELYALPAGILAGVAFKLNPDISVGMSPLVIILQILINHLMTYLKIGDFAVVKVFAFAITCGSLVNAYLTDPSSVSRVMKNLLEKLTVGRIVFLRSVVFRELKRYHLQQFSISLSGI